MRVTEESIFNVVTANGGLIAPAGSHALCLAAKHYSTPVVVCTGLFKLSPLFPHDQDSFNSFVSPNAALSFKHGKNLKDSIDVIQPYFDFVSPALVSLFVTNMGGHTPTYIYRLLGEMYDSKDYSLVL
jgi:translation initiation factor eIF-2B subunit beta